MPSQKTEPKHHFRVFYLHLLARLHDLSDKIEYGTKPALVELWQQSLEFDVSAYEITQQEAQKIAHYLARDLKVLTQYGLAAEEGVKTYFQKDSDYLAAKLWTLLEKVEDPSQIEWYKMGLNLGSEPEILKSGEWTALGRLECQKCQTVIELKDLSQIPACSCGHEQFKRVEEKG